MSFVLAISAAILILAHVCWTVLFWNACHQLGSKNNFWFLGLMLVIVSHYAFSGIVSFIFVVLEVSVSID